MTSSVSSCWLLALLTYSLSSSCTTSDSAPCLQEDVACLDKVRERRESESSWSPDEDGAEIDEDKRAKYFLGKRGRSNKYFLGKRYFWNSDDDGSSSSYEPQLRRRAKYFLGKRSYDDLTNDYATDELDKRAQKYFLGKRAKYFLGKRDGNEDLVDELRKRAKYFLGKRAKYFLGKREEEDEKRAAKYFLGKRDEDEEKRAKYFLGKRDEDKRAKYFLGKRDDELTNEDDKRAKYFLGKRSVDDAVEKQE